MSVDFRFLFAIYASIPLWFCGVRVSRVAEGRRAFEIGRFLDQVAGEQALSNETNVWDLRPCSPAAVTRLGSRRYPAETDRSISSPSWSDPGISMTSKLCTSTA